MLNFLEKCFSVLMLLYLSSGLTGFLAGDSPFNPWRLEDNPLLLAIQSAMYAVMLGFLVRHWRKFITALRGGGWVVALAFLAFVSTLWSSDPSFTLRRSLVVIATTIFGIYFGSRYQIAAQVRLLSWTSILLAVLSAACVFLLPQYGVDQQLHPGDWQGILGQKNLLGKAMAVGVIVLWSAKGILPRLVRIAALLMCAVLLLMSGSRAALVVSLALLLLVPSYRILRARMTTLVPLGVILLATFVTGIFLLVGNSTHLLSSLGRDTTLTRRTAIWNAVWMAISSHTLLGYGFGGFWAGIDGESARVSAVLGFVARHAHNGFLDLWLELGIAGLFLFAVGYLQAARNGAKLLRMSSDRVAIWPLQYLAFMLLYNLVEGPILRQNSLYWALYVVVVVSAAQAVRIGQPRAAFAMDAAFPPERLERQSSYLSRRTAGRAGDLHPRPGRSAA